MKMTATLESNRELECVQNELKKAIHKHQLILVKMRQEPNDSLKGELKSIQQHIQELGEKQKVIISNLRKESETKCRVEITSNGDTKPQIQSTQKTQVALPQTPTKKSFLISKGDNNNNNSSNSNNSNNNSSGNKKLPQPALAVRTISGQTKLLVPVSAAAATAKKQNQHQQILVVPTPGGGARLATSAANSNSLLRKVESKSPSNNGGNSNSNNSSNFKSLLASNKSYNNSVTLQNNTASLQQQQYMTRYQMLLKEQHAKAQQEELKIPEPKRKESFLAALGLVTKEALSEIQNKKCERKRRTTANPQFSNAAIEAKRITALEMAAKRAKRRMLLAAAANAASAKTSTSRNFLQSSATRVPRVSEQNRNKAKETITEKPTNNYYSSSVTISSGSRSLSCSKVSNNCFVCDEHCNPDLDAVMFCKDCRCLFHATCASNIDDITKTMSVPCPKCDKQKPLDEEVGQNDSSNDEFQEEKDEEEGNVSRCSRVKLKSVRKDDIREKEYMQKIEERKKLKRKRMELLEKCESFRKRFAKLKEDLIAKEEENRRALLNQKQILRDVEKLKEVVELVKKTTVKSSNCNQKEKETEISETEGKGIPVKETNALGDTCIAKVEIGSTIIIPQTNLEVGDNMVIVSDKAVGVLVVGGDEKVDQFEDETSAAVASIQGIQDQIEVDL